MSQQSAYLEVTDDEFDDYMDDDEFSMWIAQQHQQETRRFSTTLAFQANSRHQSSIMTRNPPISSPLESLTEYTHEDVRLTPKSYVELHDNDFMRIMAIVRDTSTSKVTIRGYIYWRTREMNGLLEHKANEVCWILHVDDDDPREPLIQGIETRAVSVVVRRRNIRLTNMAFPALSFRGEVRETEETVTNHRVLVCRYKYLCFYANAKARNQYQWCEKGLHRIRAEECDKRADNDLADDELRRAWRGDTALGGSNKGWLEGEKEFLRQENISHKGNKTRQSLKMPDGPDLPIEDPMERRGVGSILVKADLLRELPVSAAATDGDRAFTTDTLHLQGTPSGSVELKELASPFVPALQQRRGNGLRDSPLSALNKLVIESEGSDIERSTGLFDLTRGLTDSKSSIKAPRAKPKAFQTVEIDAQVKTSSSAGTFQKRYEGKITSTFVPSPRSKRKRSPKGQSSLSARTIKGSSMESSAQLNYLRLPRVKAEESYFGMEPSDRDEEWPKAGGPTAGDSELSTHSSLGSSEVAGPSVYTSHHNSVNREDRNPAHNDELDEVIDLTTPQDLTGPLFHRSLQQSSYSRSSSSVSGLVPGVDTLHAFAERATPQPKRERSISQTTIQDEKIRIKSKMTAPLRAKQLRYTFGDCFCGAGGMSRGAIAAGLPINWGFDFNQMACQTYGMNFFRTPIYNVGADEFVDGRGDHKVDICHLSPPCQFFSDAHTVQGKDDDMNTASLFAVFNLLKVAKPRVVTLEQTSGLIRRHPLFFNAVINMFTARGFSVRWRVMNCADFGLPQRRMRLVIIASCPGEALPTFPRPTHSANAAQTGLKPWTTINDAISIIPQNWYNHDLHRAKPRNAAPTTGDKIATCITTSGGPGNIHPSGKRDYTHREYACLQSFPLGHKFGGRQVKKQIGNAVPPVVATVLLEEVKRSLMAADGLL